MLTTLYNKLRGQLLADINSATTLIPIDSDTLAILQGAVDFNGGDWTYLTFDDGAFVEEVKAIGVSGSMLVVERGKSGSTPRAFSELMTVVSSFTGLDAIKDVIAATPFTSDITVGTAGLAYDSSNDPLNPIVTVDQPNFSGDGHIEIVGRWPTIQFALVPDSCGCCGGEGGGGSGEGVTSLVLESTILQGDIAGGVLTLNLPTPNFTGAGTVAVTGAWPNFTITGSGSGGGGTVTSVSAGDGLTVTGNPAVNPTISIENTGVAAGDYSGFIVNPRGQITNLPVGFSPISEITIPNGATVGRVGGEVTITLTPADVAVPGIAPLADSGSPIDPNDDNSIVTPKLLAAALSSGGGGSAIAGSGTGEADALYNNILSSTALGVTLASGEQALLIGEVQVLDGAAPLTPVAFGVAVFDATNVKHYSTKICTQSSQSILGSISGPFSGTLSIVTTELPAGATLHSAHLAVLKI